jgi:hypothetical protein
MTPSVEAAPRGTVAGIVILACGALAVFAMAHHPSVEAHTPAQVIAEIGKIGPVNHAVHGAMIAIIAALLFGFTVFSMRRGLAKEAVLGGLIAQAIGTTATIVAAMTSGFVISGIAARYATASPKGLEFAAQAIGVGAGVVQLFGKLGVIGMTVAIVLWSIDLVRSPGSIRLTGVLGFAAGALAVAIVVFGGHLTPQTLGVIVAGQAIWYCAVGALLIRRVL